MLSKIIAQYAVRRVRVTNNLPVLLGQDSTERQQLRESLRAPEILRPPSALLPQLGTRLTLAVSLWSRRPLRLVLAADERAKKLKAISVSRYASVRLYWMGLNIPEKKMSVPNSCARRRWPSPRSFERRFLVPLICSVLPAVPLTDRL